MPSAPRLSKSRFVTGCQCHKLLWWTVHEPDAPELQPDKVLQDLFDQGRLVGEAARARFPGGVLIDLPHHAGAERVAATQAALDSGAPAIFEATFIADGTFVAVDVLEKHGDGYRLTEVKSSSSQKPEHIPDVAVQARVARARGLPHQAALVEEVLEHLVGLQLDGVGLVDLPPEFLVALEAGGEAGFGEARRGLHRLKMPS